MAKNDKPSGLDIAERGITKMCLRLRAPVAQKNGETFFRGCLL